ncbi:MAG: ImmA/IrrE family metallo-endopeptidase [Tissierellia bacterium]|nr:ImmA/IrrE family metallo-endopeptidase [Tissierellia bacterium]
MRKDLIEQKANDLRSEWGLSPYNPVSINQLLLKLNILTVFKPLSDNFSGMCLKRDENRFILINSNHPIGRQNFTIGHELYHLYVQDNFEIHYCNPGSRNQSPEEKRADFFSSNFLMPKTGIMRMIPDEEIENKEVSISTLLRLENYFGVSRGALLVRLSSLKLISNDVFKSLKSKPVIRSAKQYGYNTVLYKPGNDGLVVGDYGVKAKSLFDKGIISEGHYIELLSKIGIDPTDNDTESVDDFE